MAPVLVGEIEDRELTSARWLRHPSWRGQRIDHEPNKVTVPSSA
jgi:hypothetical protein